MWKSHLLHYAAQLYARPVTSVTRHFAASSTAVLRVQGLRRTCIVSPDAALWSGMAKMTQSRSSHMSSIKDRRAYDEKAFQHVKGSDVESLDLVSDGRLVSVKWADGKTSPFHSVWLRSVCFCPKCRMDHTGQSIVEFDNISSKSRILSAEDDGEGCLTVQWKEDPGHTGIFPLKFLKAQCYSKESLEEIRNNAQMTFSKDMVIPSFQHDEVLASRKALYKWVKALNETGISVVKGVPRGPGTGKQVVQRIAELLQHTVYGEVDNIKRDPRPINAAYTPKKLELHMDQVMYESPPGVQALHCIEFDENIVGGENIFVDMFEVVEAYRKQYPKEFDILCEVPVGFETLHYDRDWPTHMIHRRPTFATNKYGDLTGVVWNPHHIAALQVEEELVEPFFDAYGKFYKLINNFSKLFRIRLRAGDMVTFNNRRMSHGRAAFSGDGERFLQGYYIEISEFKSCVQVLSNLEGDGKPPVRVGNFDSL